MFIKIIQANGETDTINSDHIVKVHTYPSSDYAHVHLTRGCRIPLQMKYLPELQAQLSRINALETR